MTSLPVLSYVRGVPFGNRCACARPMIDLLFIPANEIRSLPVPLTVTNPDRLSMYASAVGLMVAYRALLILDLLF